MAARKAAAPRAATPKEVFKPLPHVEPPEPDPEPEPKPVVVTYEGSKRIEHTLTGKVFEHGDTHRMTDVEALNLQTSAMGEEFTVREVPQQKARG